MSYLEYWGFEKNPFDSVPDPSMYHRDHSTVKNAVSELRFAIEEGNECLAVLIGEAGLGKTMALRVVLDELDPESYRIAFVTNPDLTFAQLLREIIGQLNGERCTVRGKDDLLEEFNQILCETADLGKKVLVFIDEGNSMRVANLEGLRLLTNMQEDEINLVTVVIAGQPKLARMLEHPTKENLFQRIGVYCRLEPLGSAAEVGDYIRHRLKVAGGSPGVFSERAVNSVLLHTQGFPRLVNRICKLALKTAETNGLPHVGCDLVEEIASIFDTQSAYRFDWQHSELKGMPVQEGRSIRDRLQSETGVAPEEAVTPGMASVDRLSVSVSVGCNEGHQTWVIPEKVLEVMRRLPDRRSRLRFAGQVAAQELREHPERYKEVHEDPVKVWDELRNQVLTSAGCSVAV